jgi:DeoR/GlpR family transcriptional regulator of sugar metabolism
MDDTVVRAKRAMMSACGRNVLIVNHLRFGHAALHKLADLSEFDAIITDAPPAPEAMAELDLAGLSLTFAPPKEAA